ncbi:EamA family transporter [Acidisoma cellulosilytica]|uniref:EamA family transporter n=1 Tax=Acidisoma cellulosilyticum TaxID=2802395 RepID=A0A964E5F9_9PROT|nr:EamA family transporter [Acidisoma cellulosilyticum]MCB8882479.1 EamA family transporter [Acidisoma cellulosilyticum]
MISNLTRWRNLAEKIPVVLWLVTAICSAQLASSLSVSVIHRIGSPTATSLRLIWGAVFFLAVARPRIWSIGRKQLTAAFVLGLITTGMSFFFFAAVGRIPLGMAVSIEFLGPLAVALAGSRRLLDLLWVILAALGVWLLTLQDHGRADTLGLILAAASGLCWGGYILMTRRVGRAFSGMQGLALSMAVAGLVGLPIGIVPHWQVLGFGSVIAMALISLLSPILTFGLEMASLRRMEPRHFGILMSLEPVMAAVMGFLVLGQRLSTAQLAGMACVTLASFGTVAARPKQTQTTSNGEA